MSNIVMTHLPVRDQSQPASERVQPTSDCSEVQNWTRPLLILVEGHHDVEFLRRISTKLALELPDIPDLTVLQRGGQVVFVPVGGGNFMSWSNRFAPLALPGLHDLEAEPRKLSASSGHQRSRWTDT